jgi:CheY-like chemotaxis protein
MTTGKRALIVDDSRSARVILSRMLEQHGLVVDTAESAEQALEYLRQSRPDVIFMDHLMPGMDGFQAVQTIKSDSRTATIPLMMYTSQEGELYVSQARALGAVGVLPKTVRPVDVSRVLYQLHLLPDRRQGRSALFNAAASGGLAVHAAAAAEGETAAQADEGSATADGMPPWAMPATALSELQGGLRQSLQQLVRDQLAEQRRFMLATFEAFARRMSGEIREAMPPAAPPAAAPIESPVPEPARGTWWPVALTALLAVVPAAILGYLQWQASGRNAALARDLAEVKAALARAEAVPPVVMLAPAPAVPAPDAGTPAAAMDAAMPAAGPLAVDFVAYGEVPLAGARLDRLRGLAATLESQQFRGTILVESFTGDFCLAGNATDGYVLAEETLPVADCAVVGNPFDDTLTPAQRQSVAFANFAATLRQRTGGAIAIEPAVAGRRNPVEYPEQVDGLTAGTWNAAAAQNNRVEFRLVPAG